MSQKSLKRRNFLKAAGVGATAMAASSLPAPAIAQDRFRWKMVTCWPKNFPGVGTAAKRVADAITEMSDGQLEVKLFADGELVPAFEVFDAVREGKAECGHDTPYYWLAKNKSAAFFGSVPGGLTTQEHSAWVYYGGGQELWDELYGEFGLRAWLAGNAGMQMVGWFRDEIKSLDDIQGLKIRMAGLQAEVFNRLGGTTVNLPGGETMSALQSGVIDAAEWGGPWMDLAFGFYKVTKNCYGPGIHEPGTAQSLLVNLAAYEALPKHLQAIVRHAAESEAGRLPAEFAAKNALAFEKLVTEHGVNMAPLPDDVLKKWFEVAEDVVAETAEEGEINQRIYESWRAFRRRAIGMTSLHELGYLRNRMPT